MNKQHVKTGDKVNPDEVASVILLRGQDIGNKVVPVEEPLITKYVEHLKD